jgi:exopolysaccharide biosynthesis WecB/TagA/CpsF family protein
LIIKFEDTIIDVNIPSAEELWEIVEERFSQDRSFALATINLDHVVKLQKDAAFREAYAHHDLVVADGNPIVWLSWLAGRPRSLVPGSDMLQHLMHVAARHNMPVAFLGSTQEVLDTAAARLCEEVDGLQVICRIAPPFGFDPVGLEALAMLDEIAASGARLCFIALGAPKQERLAALGHVRHPQISFASVGASLDYVAGSQTRAPLIVRRLFMEWAWRMCSDPRRLVGRYARCFAILPRQVCAALRQRKAWI